MRKTFLFINLSIECGYNTGINHGLAYLATIPIKFGYDVNCLNLQREISTPTFLNYVKLHSPSIVAFSLPSQQLKYLIVYSKIIKNNFKVTQIAGGVGPTLDPESFLLKTSIDGICMGEGEIPLTHLCSSLEEGKSIFGTTGFYWKQKGSIIKNYIPDFVKDLATLPFPNYSIFDKNLVCPGGNINIMISRGCPHNCYYCCNNALRSIYPCHGYFRLPNVNYSILLLKEIIKQYPAVKYLGFEDDLLTARKEWFLDFASNYRESIRLPYRICARAETLTQEIVQALKESGCHKVSIGLETGNESFRRKLLNRNYTNELFVEKCHLVKSAGLELFTFNMVGFPYETDKELADTFDLNKKIEPNSGVCTFFYPYKGTELYRICEDNQLLENEEILRSITNYNTRSAIRMTVGQRKKCNCFQRKISNYLFKQSYLTGIKKLPQDKFKLLGVIYLAIWYFLYTRPFYYKICRKLKSLAF